MLLGCISGRRRKDGSCNVSRIGAAQEGIISTRGEFSAWAEETKSIQGVVMICMKCMNETAE